MLSQPPAVEAAREAVDEAVDEAAPPAPAPMAPAPSPPPPARASSGDVGSSLAELCVALDGAASAAGLESSEALQRSVANAWQAARTEQQQQIQRLKRQLEAAVALEREAPPEEERSFGETMAATTLRLEESERMRRERPGVTELWQLAENRTAGSTTERRARSRALTRATFKFLSELTAYDEDEAQRGDEAKVALPGEGLISVSGSRQRLRLLERHEAASCVEYRLFAASLAADDAFAEASGASLLVDELDANGNITAVVSRWFDGTFGKDNEEWNEALGNEIAEISEELGAKDKPLAPWLEPLSELLGRSTELNISPGDILDLDQVAERVTLFPVLLLSLVSRQGNFEPLVVYYVARVLGRFNAQALARFEGRDLGTGPDLAVSRSEASFVRATQEEVIGQLAGGVLLTYCGFLAVGAVVVYQLVSAFLGAFEPAPYDPLAF